MKQEEGSSTLKLWYLHQYFTTPSKGGGTRSYEFAKRLVWRGHHVTVITGNSRLQLDFSSGDKWKEIEVEGVQVIVLPVDYSNYMETSQRIKSFLAFAWLAIKMGWKLPQQRDSSGSAFSPPQLIFATSTPLTVGIPGIVLSWRYWIPLVFEVRDLWPEAPVQMGVFRNPILIACLRALEKMTYFFSKHIVALSPGIAKGITQGRIPRSKVTVIPNSSDNDFFSPGPPEEEFLKKWGLQDTFIVAYAGALGEANGLDLIAKAAAFLQERGEENLVFALAGEGRGRPLLEKEVQEQCLNNVIFMGQQDKYEVCRLYRAAGCALVLFRNLPVLQTNSPNKFFDALAAGLPVVSNMQGWISRLLQEHSAGISVPPEDGEALAEAVLRLKEHPEERERMGRNARHLAQTQFDRGRLAIRLEQLLKSYAKK